MAPKKDENLIFVELNVLLCRAEDSSEVYLAFTEVLLQIFNILIIKYLPGSGLH